MPDKKLVVAQCLLSRSPTKRQRQMGWGMCGRRPPTSPCPGAAVRSVRVEVTLYGRRSGGRPVDGAGLTSPLLQKALENETELSSEEWREINAPLSFAHTDAPLSIANTGLTKAFAYP